MLRRGAAAGHIVAVAAPEYQRLADKGDLAAPLERDEGYPPVVHRYPLGERERLEHDFSSERHAAADEGVFDDIAQV